MKRILSLSLTLAVFLTFSACKNSKIQNNEPNDNNSIKLNADNVKYMVSATEDTLFVVNPDKTVSVAGLDNGTCEVSDWTNVEKIFATETATYGIQSDGTCLVAENFTSSTRPEYNNAREITNNFVLFEDGTVIPKNATFKNGTFPKCIDILEVSFCELWIVTNNGKAQTCNFEFKNGECDFSLDTNYDVVEILQKISNVKELSFCEHRKSGNFNFNKYLSVVRNDGTVYAYKGISSPKHPNSYVSQWNNVNSCVPVGDDVFIAITNDKKILACGREFSKLGEETPKLLTIDNALKVFTFTPKHNGKYSNYAIILCEDGSVYAYCLGAMHTNTANAFSKWKSFEVL